MSERLSAPCSNGEFRVVAGAVAVALALVSLRLDHVWQPRPGHLAFAAADRGLHLHCEPHEPSAAPGRYRVARPPPDARERRVQPAQRGAGRLVTQEAAKADNEEEAQG